MNVIFDIGKVLIDFDFEQYMHSIFDKDTADAVIAATWHSPVWSELDKGVMSDEQVLCRFIENAPGHEREIRRMFALLGNIPVMKDSTVPMIQSLKAKGYGVYYLSNYFEYLMHTAPWVLDFIRYTDGGIFSCHVKITKPDKRIYELLCGKFSLSPAECIFIDDTERNVRAAEGCGMKGIHYTGQTSAELTEMIDRLSDAHKDKEEDK